MHVNVSRGLQRERGRENEKQVPCAVWSATRGSIPQPQDHDLSQNQELDTQLTGPPRPTLFFYLFLFFIFFFFLKILFIYLTERERQPAREGTQAGGVGEEEAGS